MRGYLSGGLLIAYFGVGLWLEARAWQAGEPGTRWWARRAPLDDPALFPSAEGQRRRARSLRF